MKVWRKKTIRHLLNGKRVPPGTPGAEKRTESSKRFYGTLNLANGETKQTALSEDRETSQKLLRRLQTDEDRAKALGLDRSDRERLKPLSGLLTEYERELQSRENTAYHVSRTTDCIRAILEATSARAASDLHAGRIADVLTGWRKQGRPTNRKGRKPVPMSVSRSNVYARAVKGFSRWLWSTHHTSRDSLVSLPLLNVKPYRHHIRRALTSGELQRLVMLTAQSSRIVRSGSASMTGLDRAMLYTLAAYTGLRASELASLSVHSFDLEAMAVIVDAAYSKRRRDDMLPLHRSLCEPLRQWLSRKGGSIWPGPWAKDRRGASILRRDLAISGIAYRDELGRVVDFHSLRHTFIASLARSGVHPSEAKELARHSTITLTLDVYGHVETHAVRRSLNTLPALNLSTDASVLL